MIFLNDNLDLSLIYLLRKMGKNFMQKHKEISINGLPLSMTPIVEEIENAKTYEGYIDNILMKMNEDA